MDIAEFYRDNDLVVMDAGAEKQDAGKVAVFGGPDFGTKLTPGFAALADLDTYVEENADRIAAAAKAGTRQPSRRFCRRLGDAIRAASARDRMEGDSVKSLLPLFQTILDDPEKADAHAKVAEHVAGLNRDIEAGQVRETRRARMLETLEGAPATLLLPLGAVVRLRKDFGSEPDSPGSSGRRSIQPKAGTYGIVVGAPASSEFPVRVAFGGVTGEDDGSFFPADDIENPATLFFDAEHLDVVGFARFADGTECRSAEPVATHLSREALPHLEWDADGTFELDEGHMMLYSGDRVLHVIFDPTDRGDEYQACAFYADRTLEDFIAIEDIEAPVPTPKGP